MGKWIAVISANNGLAYGMPCRKSGCMPLRVRETIVTYPGVPDSGVFVSMILRTLYFVDIVHPSNVQRGVLRTSSALLPGR